MSGAQLEGWLQDRAQKAAKFISESGADVPPEVREQIYDASNKLADQVGTLLRAYALLTGLSWEGSLSQLLESAPKVNDVTEDSRTMERLITEQPFNPMLQKRVIDVVQRGRDLAGSPPPKGGGLPSVEDFYRPDNFPEGRLVWGTEAMKLDDCLVAAGSIYHFVAGMAGVADPPAKDWFKKPIQTLYVGGGDCDCLTILLSSMAWYAGFTVILNFQPGHIFPSLVLKRLVKVPKEELGEDRIAGIQARYEREVERLSQDDNLKDEEKRSEISAIREDLSSLAESAWVFEVRDVEVPFDPSLQKYPTFKLDFPVPWIVRSERIPAATPSSVSPAELPFTAIYTAGFQRLLSSIPEHRRLRLKEESASLENSLKASLADGVYHRRVISRGAS